MIKNTEEAVMLLIGENMALGLLVKALIETHPNPGALRQVVADFQKQGDEALEKVPPSNITLFRLEQLMDELVSHIKA